jgi:hypothetical protein
VPLEFLLKEVVGAEVVDRHRAVAVPKRPAAGVAAEAERGDAVQVPAQDRGGRGAAQQRGQQVAAGRQRVVQCDPLSGQQQGAVQLAGEQRLGAETAGVGHQRLAFGLAPQGQRQPAGHQRQDQHHGKSSQQPTQAPAGAGFAFGAAARLGDLLFGGGAAFLQELRLPMVPWRLATARARLADGTGRGESVQDCQSPRCGDVSMLGSSWVETLDGARCG